MARLTPLLLLPLVGCAEPDLDAMFTLADVSSGGRTEAVDALAALADGAEESLVVSIPGGQDTEVSDILVRTADRGVSVEVVTDYDRREDPGIVALADAGIPVTLADDGITYFEFNLNADVSWTSEETILSSSFAVADHLEFMSASDLGEIHDGRRIIVEGRGQDLADDLFKEHNQLFGGADAVSTTAFDNLAKSIADNRWLYPLGTGPTLEVWFGPQERVTKRIIDSVYSAKASVYVLTDDLANEGLVKALQHKAGNDFDVQVIVGPSFGNNSAPLSRLLTNDAPDVVKRQVTTARTPTVVLIDLQTARDGNTYPAKGFVLSHDLYSAERLYRGGEVVTDQLVDGVLWTLEDPRHDYPGNADTLADELRVLVDTWQDHMDRSEAL